LAPANAQTAGDPTLRGSILPQSPTQDAAPGPPPAAGDGGVTTTQDGTVVPGTETGEGGAAAQGETQAQPLGGLGDELPPLEPGAEVEEAVVEEGLGVNLLPEEPFRETPPLHTALQPEPHDLDPSLPIGIRLGSFLLFPEVETGTILTNNVLGTKTDPHGDVAYEVAPRSGCNPTGAATH
jgi:hypothetical protein